MIHVYGMHQRNSNWMDGVAHVTQCGIPPLANFTYIFNASQYGTIPIIAGLYVQCTCIN